MKAGARGVADCLGRVRWRRSLVCVLGALAMTCSPGSSRAEDPISGITSGTSAGIEQVPRWFGEWYARTPPLTRLSWGGLAACALLSVVVVLGRSVVARRGAVIPSSYWERFHRRLLNGQLDAGKAQDYCELNRSPVSRVAVAAVRRWNRPEADQERAVRLAVDREGARLRCYVGTLRRIAALSPLVGLLGTLDILGCFFRGVTETEAWGPMVAESLSPLTAGVGLAILALVAFDGLTGRIEELLGTLERTGIEVVDAISMHGSAGGEPRRTGRTGSDTEASGHSSRSMRGPHPHPHE